MPEVPKPPAFDGKASATAWTDGVLKPDGTPYAAFGKFPAWKTWADRLRDHVEALRLGVFGPDGIKEDLDRHTGRLNTLNARVTALEEKPSVPFPGSG